jgi:mannose/fructose/N-acetylgalactosamine-specific phosphotransferase system component IIC
MNAVVVMVVLTTAPVGGAVGHEVSCGAPISSTLELPGKKIAPIENSNIAITNAVKILFLCILLYSLLKAHYDSILI